MTILCYISINYLNDIIPKRTIENRLHSFNLEELITEPTHYDFQANSSSLIDFIDSN